MPRTLNKFVPFACWLIAATALGQTVSSDDQTVPRATADWAMYNYDVLGTRHNRGEHWLSVENVAELTEIWQYPAADAEKSIGVIHATPTVVNGYVYFGTATYPAFYKLTPDGNLEWVYPLNKQGSTLPSRHQQETRFVPTDGVYNAALVSDDAVYFGDAAGKIYALDRKTGKEKWKIDSHAADFPGAHPANVFLSSPILADGKIIIGGGGYEHAAVLFPGYKCCSGRGCVLALDPQSGEIQWKYDVGPEPQAYDPPLKMKFGDKEAVFYYGPSTSSVWCTPSYDVSTNTIYFGTDVHNAPRKPTDDDPRNYTRHSAAVIALDVRDGQEKWLTQITKEDVWNHLLPNYDPETGLFKDQSIGDTPKIYSIDVEGTPTKVVGFGTKNGGYYVLRTDNGQRVANTPIYDGPPVDNPNVNPRTLALPSLIGGIQTGCATDGKAVYTNGIDALDFPPTGGRVTSISLNTKSENWRHNRPNVATVPRRLSVSPFRDVGDACASGIAVANGVVYFTTLVSGKLVALDASSGGLLKEIELGPVFAGPSVSRGRIYIGTGNTLFSPFPSEDFFPKKYVGELHCFGLPGEDEVDRLGSGNE